MQVIICQEQFGYRYYIDEELKGETKENIGIVTGLTPGNNNKCYITAVDGAGNESKVKKEITIATKLYTWTKYEAIAPNPVFIREENITSEYTLYEPKWDNQKIGTGYTFNQNKGFSLTNESVSNATTWAAYCGKWMLVNSININGKEFYTRLVYFDYSSSIANNYRSTIVICHIDPNCYTKGEKVGEVTDYNSKKFEENIYTNGYFYELVA